jgi:hypothetical protein
VAAGPISRILSTGLLQQDGHSSGPCITARLKRPTRRLWRTKPARASGEPENPSLFGLAPCGVCPACRIAATAVRSYRTFSPLPWRCRHGGMFSVALSVECSHPAQRTRKDGAPSRTLSGTLLCGVRTFLPRHLTQRERPSGPAANEFIIADFGRRAWDVMRNLATDFADSHGSKFSFLLPDPRESVARSLHPPFSVPSVWQVLVQLLNLPEGVGQAFIDRGQRI